MSQGSPRSNIIENKNATEVNIDEESSQNPKVSESNTDHQEIIVNAVPINMVPPSKGSTKRKHKRTTYKKKKDPKVCSPVKTSLPNEEVDPVEPKDSEPKPSENAEPHDQPSTTSFIEPSQNDNPNPIPSSINNIPPPGTNTTSPSTIISNVLSEIQEKELNPESQDELIEKNVEPNVTTSSPPVEKGIVEEPDKEGQNHEDENDLPLSQKLKKKASAQQEIVTMEEDTDSDEGVRFNIPVGKSKTKPYKSKQVETPITVKKGKRKAEKRASGERTSRKRKLITVSESEEDVELDVLDITTSGKKRIGGRRVPANIPPATMDNVSFHSEECVQKWRFVYQRRIAHERELSQEALNCKEIMEYIEAAKLMKSVTNLGVCYERLVKEFIVNITDECSEGDEEARKILCKGEVHKILTNYNQQVFGKE
jgi:hypothetical protein